MRNKIKIDVEVEVENKIWFNFKKNIEELLEVVPNDHLVNLESIKVFYLSPFKGENESKQGFYLRENNKQGKIIICAKNVMGDFSNVFLKLCPYFSRFFLADVLYHEIGHHYQRLRHGYKEHIIEKHADQYSMKMRRRDFYSRGIGKFIYKLKKSGK